MLWRIFYGDCSTFSSADGPADLSPGLDVQAIVQPDPDVGRHVLSRFGYYWLDRGEWYGGDLFGLFDYLQRPGHKVVRFGRTISNARFREIIRAATEDPNFPRKSAWKPDEFKVSA